MSSVIQADRPIRKCSIPQVCRFRKKPRDRRTKILQFPEQHKLSTFFNGITGSLRIWPSSAQGTGVCSQLPSAHHRLRQNGRITIEKHERSVEMRRSRRRMGIIVMKHISCSLFIPFTLVFLFWCSPPAQAVTAAAGYQIIHSTNLLGELEPCG